MSLPVVEIVRLESERVDDIVEQHLQGRVFHVTKRAYWPSIQRAGAILPNAEGELPTTFGSSSKSFFRRRGCVSVFDYRLEDGSRLHGCHPLQAAVPGEEGVAVLLLADAIQDKLIPWSRCKDEGASEQIVPHVEAGYPGPLPLALVESIVFFRREEDPSCLASILQRAKWGCRR